MRFKFKYLRAGAFKRPIIPISLKNKKNKVKYLALVDSGADFNIFHADIAELLGISLDELQETEFSGIKKDAKATGRYTVLEIGIDNYFFDAPVLFSDSISSSGYGIVGQRGFFEHFKIKFDYKGDNIEIKTK